MTRIICLAVAAAVCLAGGVYAEEKAAAPQPKGPLADIMAKIPNDSAAAANQAFEELVKLGPQGIKDLAGLLVEPGKIDDSRARFAFHGLALYVSRPGAEPERMMFCETVRGLLSGNAPPAVKGFFLRQLRIAGCPKAVPAISAFLLNDELSEYAAQALLSIGGDDAGAAMLAALTKAKGKPRLTLIQDLGVLRCAAAAAELTKAASDGDREVRLAALYALGNIGDAAAVDTLTKAADSESAYERAKATDALLLLARRLGEAKNTQAAEAVYRNLWKTRTDPRERHVRCAAIQGLAAVLGAGAMDDLLAALKSDDLQIRGAAIEAAAAMPGEDVTAKWVTCMASLPSQGKIDCLGLLARRGGPAALVAVLEATKGSDEGVRVAAVTAAGAFQDEKVVGALVGLLESKNDREKQAARKALERMPGDKASAAVAAALASAAPAAKKELLGVLAARGARAHVDAVMGEAMNSDEGVRQAALSALETLAGEEQAPGLLHGLTASRTPADRASVEKALGSVLSRSANKDAAAAMVVSAMADADVPARAALVRALARVGNPKAMDAVRGYVKAAEPEVQEAAVRALAAWPDDAAAPELLSIAKTSEKQTYQVLALQGYIRLVTARQDRPAAGKLQMLQDAIAAARRPDEKKQVLGALADIKLPAALEMAAGCLSDKALMEEAAAAVVKIARNLGGNPKEQIRAAMEKVAAVSKNDGTRRDAEQVLQKLK